MSATPHRIDVHHHILPDDYVRTLAALGIADGGDVPFPKWSAEGALALMDRNGIGTAVTSIAAPGVHFGDSRAARDLARRCNEFSARLVGDHPNRFGAFASLPLPDVDGALAELSYALDTLHLDGVVLLASIGERYLGDPAFDPVFAELNSSLREVVDPSHILFGSDSPFLPEPLVDASIRGLAEYGPFDATARAAIERGSALSLFPRLRALTANGR